MNIMKQALKFVLGKFGYKISKTYIDLGQRGIHYQLFQVDIKDCVDVIGNSFALDGNNHWVRCLHEYSQNPSVDWKSSSLYCYYKNNSASDLNKRIFPEAQNAIYTFSGLAILPWTPFDKIEKALQDSKNCDTSSEKKFLGYFGPASDAEIEREFKRTVGLYDSIVRDGYVPEQHIDKYGLPPYSWGVLLKNGNEFKMLIMSGKHKLAALSALGHKTLFVKFPPVTDSSYVPVVDIANVANWPCVKMGIYSEAQAKEIFLRYF